MADLGGFNANEHEPNSFEAIPAGNYRVAITESELKPTKSGNGKYLKLKLIVLDKPHINRVLFDNLNIDNPNATAVQIAKGTLSAICRAVGVLTPKDSAELHNKPLIAAVKVTKDQDGNPSNAIKGYKPIKNGITPAQSATPPAAATTETAEAPWN